MADTTSTDVVEFVVKGLETIRSAYKELGVLQTKLGATTRDVTSAYNQFARSAAAVTKSVMTAAAAQAHFLMEEQRTIQVQTQATIATNKLVLARTRLAMAEQKTIQVQTQASMATGKIMIAQARLTMSTNNLLVAQARLSMAEQKTAQIAEVTKQMKLRLNMARYIIRNTEEMTDVEKAWITELLKAGNALKKVGQDAKQAQGDIKVFGNVTRDQLGGALNVLSGGGGVDAITGILSALGLVTGQLELALIGIGIKLVAGIASQLGKIPGIIFNVFKKGFDLVRGIISGFLDLLNRLTQPIRQLFGTIFGVFGGMQLSNMIDNMTNALSAFG